jgi:hypothetical protein
LIAHGHAPQAIAQYTLAQVRLYLAAISRHEVRHEARAMSQQLALQVLAVRGEPRAIEKLLDRLQKIAEDL